MLFSSPALAASNELHELATGLLAWAIEIHVKTRLFVPSVCLSFSMSVGFQVPATTWYPSKMGALRATSSLPTCEFN